MNSILNKNLELFRQRFPQLFSFVPNDLQENEKLQNEICSSVTIKQSRTGLPTALFGDLALHSSYDPQKEANRLVLSDDVKNKEACVFMGAGLGYGAIEFTKEHPNKTLIIIESDFTRFLVAICTVDWQNIFNHNSCVLLLAAPQQSVIAILEKIGISNCAFLCTKSQIAHNESYFSSLNTLIERNKQKKEINDRTLKRFSLLWLKNMCQNAKKAATLGGVINYKNSFGNLPAFVIAAGPSLDTILPFLKEIHKRTITICVDTALKACLNVGVQPDFIISVDPQYWNIRHLDGLKSPNSVLITELASYPPTFRFECKEVILCSSLYPLGKFIENQIGTKGELCAGGSVATTAWEFARFCGAKNIYIAGLDLAFPENKTHFKGSTFEERAHRISNRLNTAETSGFNALYGAYPYKVCDYNNNEVLTDKRMSLYAWWFESKCAEYSEIKTQTVTPKGMKIPGIGVCPIQKLLELDTIEFQKNEIKEKRAFFANQAQINSFLDALEKAKKLLNSILFSAEKACDLCNKGLQGKGDIKQINQKLSEIDKQILQNEASELASLVFPNEKKISELTKSVSNPLKSSLIVYNEIIKSVKTHLKYLNREY